MGRLPNNRGVTVVCNYKNQSIQGKLPVPKSRSRLKFMIYYDEAYIRQLGVQTSWNWCMKIVNKFVAM